MTYDDRICLNQLKIEHEERLKETYTTIENLNRPAEVGTWFLCLGLMLFFGWLYSFVYGLVRERSIAWLAGLTYGITHLHTGALALVVIMEGIQTIRRIRYHKKVRKLKQKFLFRENSTTCEQLRSGRATQWDVPLSPKADYAKQIRILQKKRPSAFQNLEWMIGFFSVLSYPLSIGWTITGGLALCNVLSVSNHFSGWVIVLGLVIACAAAVLFIYNMRQDCEEGKAAFAYLIGPAVFVAYMLIATVILLIGMAVGWLLSALPVIIIIAVIILWIRNS